MMEAHSDWRAENDYLVKILELKEEENLRKIEIDNIVRRAENEKLNILVERLRESFSLAKGGLEENGAEEEEEVESFRDDPTTSGGGTIVNFLGNCQKLSGRIARNGLLSAAGISRNIVEIETFLVGGGGEGRRGEVGDVGLVRVVCVQAPVAALRVCYKMGTSVLGAVWRKIVG